VSKKLLSIKYGSVYIQWDPADNILITRDDRPMAICLSYSEWNFLMLATHLHGWPTAPPVDFAHPYSLIVEPWDNERDTSAE